ncbi:MAG: segregation/condensation protein A [Lactovum sp.]
MVDEEFKLKLSEEEVNPFEGPLDLLLHLVQSYKVDIFEVSLLSVIEQYLAYLSTMKSLNLELAGEYMLMTSQLMLIKSRRLLPTVSEVFVEETEMLEQDLLAQIIDYQQIKNVSDDLLNLHSHRAKHYSKQRTEIVSSEVHLARNLTSIDLFLVFSQILKQKKIEERENHTIIEAESYTIEDKIKELNQLLTENKELNFIEIFEYISSRDELITIFLALLEMVKSNQILLRQEESFGEILLRKK